MKELVEIINQTKQLQLNEKGVLATVVGLVGSGYRRPGARMLIKETGETFGTVSGGCLEADVLEHAKDVWRTNQAKVITYDTTKNEDSVFGLGMGCRGEIRILLENAQSNPVFDFLDDCFAQRKSGAIATLINKPENFSYSTGTKFFFRPTEPLKTNFNEENPPAEDWFQNLLSDLFAYFPNKNVFPFADLSQTKCYLTPSGEVEFFIEPVKLPLKLFIFGSGYDAIPLLELADKIGWQVIVIDHRQAWATKERFPQAQEIIVEKAENLPRETFFDENAAAVLMTHNYERDRETFRVLHSIPLNYIGALGPKKRTEKILKELSFDGINFNEQQLEKIYAPIGLDIGAENPEDIAIAIISELCAVLSNHKAGFLRDKQSGIHQTS
jgi:xanthine/CO dehydrogenase XdhC/CoxF family maturation factor